MAKDTTTSISADYIKSLRKVYHEVMGPLQPEKTPQQIENQYALLSDPTGFTQLSRNVPIVFEFMERLFSKFLLHIPESKYKKHTDLIKAIQDRFEAIKAIQERDKK